MTRALRALTASAFLLSLTATAAAQTTIPDSVRGTTPGTGLAVVDLTTPTAAAPAVQTPTPAECLGQPACQPGPWVVFAPYAWVFGVHGTVGAGLVTAPVDVSVGDALSELDKLKGALQLHTEAGYGNVGVIADLTYLNFAGGGALATLDSQTLWFELLGLYRVIDTGRQAGGVTFDLLAGARYYHFSNSIELQGLTLADRTSSWIDLVVGARAAVQVTDDLGVFARGDIGGFGIGHSSTQACNIIVGLEYRCCECASLIGGYRWFKIDRESGVGRDRFLLDATLAGPFAAFAFRY
ncbi:MAG TPA: hypothetical protein VKD90_29445 [Gemmataceae bacterium]|nr:hypothetical protein [Gemmataceae bacterium]